MILKEFIKFYIKKGILLEHGEIVAERMFFFMNLIHEGAVYKW